MVEDPSHVKQLSLNHVCEIWLGYDFIEKINALFSNITLIFAHASSWILFSRKKKLKLVYAVIQCYYLCSVTMVPSESSSRTQPR
jgi:hypothetical protein